MKRKTIVLWVLILSICAFMLNKITINIIFGVDFILGSIPVLLASVIFGPIAGVITAVASSASTFFNWNHFNAFPGFILEAVFIGIFFKKKKLNLIVLDIIYWFTIGIACVFVFYYFSGKMEMGNIEMIGLKQAVNGIVNSVIVTIILLITEKTKPITSFDYKKINSIENLFFTFLNAVIIVALFTQLSFSSKLTESRFKEDIDTRLNRAITEIEATISVWTKGYIRLANTLITSDMSEKNYEKLIESETAVKYILIVNESGNINRVFPDSGVFPDKINLPQDKNTKIFSCTSFKQFFPDSQYIAIAIPIIASGNLESRNLVMLLDFEEIIGDLILHLNNDGQSFLIMDGRDEIILSSLRKKISLDPRHMYFSAEEVEAGNTLRIWYPEENVPSITRRKKSVFLNKGTIKSTGWEIFVSESSTKMFNRIFNINTSYLKIISSFMIILSAAALILVRRITKPLSKISEIINKLRKFPGKNETVEWPDTNIGEIQSISSYLTKLIQANSEYTDMLKKSAQRLTTTLMSIGDAVIVADTDSSILIFNKVAEDLTEWSANDAIGSLIDNVLLLSNPEDHLLIQDSSGRIRRSEYILTSKTGKTYRVAGTASPIVSENQMIGSIVVFQDETNRIQRDNQLKNAQKMESIGLLAGGIAHDFNNLLTGIMGYADIIDARLENDNQLKDYSSAILDTGEKAADLVQQLLSFARKGSFLKKDVDLNKIIQKTTHMLSAGKSEKITVIEQLNADNASVRSDETMLHSMFLNLGINAKDAMPDGGTISFSTEETILDTAFCSRSQFTISPGNFILARVSDTGTGISEEKLEYIFEPFFTTKETGKGVGLGLAAVYGTVVEMKGAIHVESYEGEGTTFSIYLPIIKT